MWNWVESVISVGLVCATVLNILGYLQHRRTSSMVHQLRSIMFAQGFYAGYQEGYRDAHDGPPAPTLDHTINQHLQRRGLPVLPGAYSGD